VVFFAGYWTYGTGSYRCYILIYSSVAIATTYSSALSYNSTIFSRTGNINSVFYYEAIRLTVNVSGLYYLFSNSTVDTYGYLYVDYFNVTNLFLEDDNCAGGQQFYMTQYLTLNKTYIMVVTTYAPNVTGLFSVTALGPASVSLS
jgi:hypothetical protein